MSVKQKVALSIFIPSALVALVNAWAFQAYPDEWGGPNIGGGVIQLLAYAGMLVGAVFFVLDIMEKRQNRSTR